MARSAAGAGVAAPQRRRVTRDPLCEGGPGWMLAQCPATTVMLCYASHNAGR